MLIWRSDVGEISVGGGADCDDLIGGGHQGPTPHPHGLAPVARVCSRRAGWVGVLCVRWCFVVD